MIQTGCNVTGVVTLSVMMMMSLTGAVGSRAPRDSKKELYRGIKGSQERNPCSRVIPHVAQRAERPSRFRLVTGGSEGQRGGATDHGTGSTCSTRSVLSDYARHSKSTGRPRPRDESGGGQCVHVAPRLWVPLHSRVRRVSLVIVDGN
jgi:hypothetical protein